MTASTQVLMTILSSVQNRGQPVIEAQYLSTGRLTNLTYTIKKLFKFFLTILSSNNYEVENDVKIQPDDLKSVTKKLIEKNEKEKNIFMKNKINKNRLLKFVPNLNLLPNLNSIGSTNINNFSCHFLASEGILLLARLENSVHGRIIYNNNDNNNNNNNNNINDKDSDSNDKDKDKESHSNNINYQIVKELFLKYGSQLLDSLLPKQNKKKVKRTQINKIFGDIDKGSNDKKIKINDKIEDDNVCHNIDNCNDNNNDNYGSKNDINHDNNGNNDSNNNDNNNNNSGDDDDNDDTFLDIDDVDFNLIRCLVGSPYNLVEFSTKILSTVIKILLKSTKKVFNRFTDMKIIEGKLYSYSELLLMILIPFNYILYPISNYQLNCYNKLFYNSEDEINEVSNLLKSEISNDNTNFHDKNIENEINNLLDLSKTNSSHFNCSLYWIGNLLNRKIIYPNTDLEDKLLKNDRENKNIKAEKANGNSFLISNIFDENIESIFEVFVLNSIWSKSVNLQV